MDLKKFIKEEVSKLHKKDVLMEQKAQIEGQLRLLKEGEEEIRGLTDADGPFWIISGDYDERMHGLTHSSIDAAPRVIGLDQYDSGEFDTDGALGPFETLEVAEDKKRDMEKADLQSLHFDRMDDDEARRMDTLADADIDSEW